MLTVREDQALVLKMTRAPVSSPVTQLADALMEGFSLQAEHQSGTPQAVTKKSLLLKNVRIWFCLCVIT